MADSQKTETTPTTTPTTEATPEVAPKATPAEVTPEVPPETEVSGDAPVAGDAAQLDFLTEPVTEDLDLDVPKEVPAEGEPAEGEKPAEPAAEPTPGEVAPEGVKPPVEDPAAAPAPTEPAPEAPQPAPAEQPQPEAPVPMMTPEEVNAKYQEVRSNAIEALSKSYYRLDEDTVEKLRDGDPQEIVPQLLSKVYFDAVTMALGQMHQQLPAAIARHMQAQQTYDGYETAFFEVWPQLVKADHATISRLAQAHRVANPNATPEAAIREVGAQAMLALGISLEGQTPPASEVPPVVPAPAAVPFSPAQGGPAGVVAQRPVPAFTALDKELFEDPDELDADK